MIYPYKLPPLILALAMGATPLFAQTSPQAKTAEPEAQATQQTAVPQQEPATPAPTQKKAPPSTGKDSPYDYRSSEEISEDVPVSFPVDI
jgi:hypothetical protein